MRVAQVVESAFCGKIQPDDMVEGKDLPPVGVAGELQIEEPQGFLLDDGPVLEKEDEPVTGQSLEDFLFPVAAASQLETPARRVVDAGNRQHARRHRGSPPAGFRSRHPS